MRLRISKCLSFFLLCIYNFFLQVKFFPIILIHNGNYSNTWYVKKKKLKSLSNFNRSKHIIYQKENREGLSDTNKRLTWNPSIFYGKRGRDTTLKNVRQQIKCRKTHWQNWKVERIEGFTCRITMCSHLMERLKALFPLVVAEQNPFAIMNICLYTEDSFIKTGFYCF